MGKVLMTLSLLALATSVHAIPLQWTVAEGGNGHWYEAVYVAARVEWTTADAAARSAGGHLATVTSELENQFIYSLISEDEFWRSPIHDGPWIGGYQDRNASDYSEPSSGWRWVTDEPFAYTNWDPRQPDNAGGAEDCLHFWGVNEKTPKWNDAANANPMLGYVVEYELIPEPSTLLALLCGLGGLVWRGRNGRAHHQVR